MKIRYEQEKKNTRKVELIDPGTCFKFPHDSTSPLFMRVRGADKDTDYFGYVVSIVRAGNLSTGENHLIKEGEEVEIVDAEVVVL